MRNFTWVWLLIFFGYLAYPIQSQAQGSFRIYPYIQIAESNKVQIRWFADQAYSSSITLKDSKGIVLIQSPVQGKEISDLYYTSVEKSQTIAGLEGQNWIGADKYFRFDFSYQLPYNELITYEVTLNGQVYTSSFQSGPDPSQWQTIRFIALSDSETDPKGMVTNRAWYPGQPLFRPFTTPALWKQKFGTTIEQGYEIPNYFLTEKQGYGENLKIVNTRNPDFLLMPGDLVQSGAYMPAWDEFWRFNAGEYAKGLSSYPIVPAIGNWENDGGINGGYGFNERGKFNPIVGRSRFHAFFEFYTGEAPKQRQSYYRTDYGPITVLTLDSSNGTPEQKRSDFPENQKLKGKDYTGPGTDTQENFTQAQYEASGGTDLGGFGPGSAQYQWLEANLKDAKEKGRLIFVQYHHIAFSSGEHGVPINHELSTGQDGTPMRILHPILEEYGVIAVLSGHDELFERSFVDENGDGKGVHYYDVGVAGDGMRGVKRDWLTNPFQTLDYNQYSKWTADQKSTEQWNTSGANPVLVDGGKHYGHLEVNLKKIKDGEKNFAQIDFEPVYAFPVLDQNYNLLRVERRVYNDPVRIMVELHADLIAPVFKKEITVELSQEGKAVTVLKDYLENEPQADWQAVFSRSPEYTCTDLAGTENQIKITDSKGNTWTQVVMVKVKDLIAPVLVTKIPSVSFDLVKGVFEFKPEDFVSSLFDNCGIKSLVLNKNKITCADYNLPIEFILTATDQSGNTTSKAVTANVSPVESKKISINPSGNYQGIVGTLLEIRLGEEFSFSVDSWLKNGATIIGEKGKAIMVSQPGTYSARILPNGGCVVESLKVTVTFSEKPYSGVKAIVELALDAAGKATLKPEDVFLSWPLADPNLDIKLSQSEFTCADLGEKQVTITIKNQAGQTWEEKTTVKVQDKLAPILVSKNFAANFDVTKGTLELKPEDFIASLTDNCGIKELKINKTTATCEDLGKETPVAIRAVDVAGNVSEATAILTLVRVEAQKVTITGPAQLCQGEKGVLTLNSTASFEVVRWRRNGVEIPGQTGKTLEVSEAGKYHAVIRYTGACLSESSEFEVKINPLPSGEIAVNGNILSAPEGNFTYQWFKDGEKLNGATSRSLTVDLMGEYTVELTSTAGCVAKLKPVTLTISGLGGKSVSQPKDLKMYPNPASELVTLELPDGVLAGNPEILVYSSEGKDVSSVVQITTLNSQKVEIRLSGLANGTYLVWVIGQNQQSHFGKLVVVD